MQYRLLMVDDDIGLLKMMRQYFEWKGYLVYQAEDAKTALEALSVQPDLILLDINMPEMDGLELCGKIRDRVFCPILFLTARTEEQDRINGLLSGGDDYILKPFSLKELDARIQAHLKREERSKRKTQVRYQDGLVIDYAEKAVYVQEKKLKLTKAEYELVEFLSRHPGQVFDKERIYERICGFEGGGSARVATELIRRIREKIAACDSREYIETVWGMGYKWVK